MTRFDEALREFGPADVHTRIRRFPVAADGVPVLVLMDGASRVDVERVRRELGAGKVTRARADVFPMAPEELIAHAGAPVVDVRELRDVAGQTP